MAWHGTPEERTSLVRRLYDGTIEQDLALDIYAEDIHWSMPKGRGKLMGERRGRAAIGEAFAYVMEVVSEYNSMTEPWEILADEQDTISFNREWGARKSDGAQFDFNVAIRWEFVDGQITSIREFIQDEEHKGSFF
jgi:ketosteroid isomerase-like protein